MFLTDKKLTGLKNSISSRLIIYILLFSSFVTFLGTSLQLYVDYSSDLKSIEKTFKQIESSYMRSLSFSLWAIDRQQIKILLHGILQLPDVQYLEIWQGKKLFTSSGIRKQGKTIHYKINLLHAYEGKENNLGTLTVEASLEGVYSRLLNRILLILGTQAIKTFLVSAFILFIFYYLVGRHLTYMAGYAKSINFKELDKPLRLQRKNKNYNDELEQLVRSINAMSKNLYDDIMSIKKAEEEAEKAEKSLRKLIEKSPLPMVITDKNQDLLFVNDKFTELFGYRVEDVPTGEIWWEKAYPDEAYRKKVQQSWLDAIEKAKRDKKEIEMQTWELITKNRIRRMCEFHMVPFDETGLIIMNDITDREAALIEKEKLEKKLQQSQKIEAVGRLAGGIAHDFNNMLSIILGNAEMLSDDLAPNHEGLMSVREIKKAAERSAKLTKQLLAFARKQTISPKAINLNTAIEGMLKMLERLIGEDIDLLWTPKQGLWPVKVDSSQIDQIMANLCINARDAIKDVGEVIIETNNVYFDEEYCLTHPEFIPGDYVLIGISDNGCGMDKETLENLFEPFFTTKKMGEGTGLGLATVYGIIKQNKGFINVYSEPDKGTTFKLYLPRYMDTLAEVPEKMREKYQKGTETILLAEDEKSILEMTKSMLERLGYKVLAANTPEEAIKISKEYNKEIHLLMTDVVMPSMNGRELADIILKSFPDMKCLFTSGYTANVIAKKGVLYDGLNFINKPFSRRDLSVKVREVLHNDES